VVASEVMEALAEAEVGPPAESYRRLYKIDSAGKVRVWFMEREGHKHRVVAGIDGGSLVENAWTDCVSKGKGKAQTTPEEQAIKEVEALYKKSLDRDYYETPEEAAGPPRNYLPMLAESWKATTWEKWVGRVPPFEPHGSRSPSGAYFQPKLDGYCCISGAVGLQSREGLPILTAIHVIEALASFFREYPEARLHGELYNHDLKNEFEKLGSLLKKQKGITQEHIDEVRAKVQYHIYDFPRFRDGDGSEERPFGDRYADLVAKLHGCVRASNGVLQIVETSHVRDVDHLIELTAQAVEDGYEGGIGRLHLPYEKAKRSWSVIKIKTFDDDEFDVVRIEEGKGNYAGYAKRVVCWRKDADRSDGPTKENTFEAGIKGKRDQWLADLLTADHKVVTIRYFGYTQGGAGVPRMGVAIKWHDDKRVL
jgi:DNA ligase-1